MSAQRLRIVVAMMIIGISLIALAVSVPLIDVAEVGEAFRSVGLPILMIFAVIGWGVYFRMWAVKTYGLLWGVALTLAPIIALVAVVFAFSNR